MSKNTLNTKASKWLMAGNDFVYALNAHGENFFCVSVQRGKNDDHKRIDDTDIESIARLIAAAPELLEALQFLFNSYKSLADSGDAGNWNIEDQPEGIKAMEAIRKATGE